MSRTRLRWFVVIALILVLALTLVTAHAGTSTISAVIPATGPIYHAQGIAGTSCIPASFPTIYVAIPFQVDTAGTYSFSLVSYTGVRHYSYIYVDFNPADPGTGCLGAVSSELLSTVSVALTPGAHYYLVSDNDSTGESTFAVEVSGPGSVIGGGQPVFTDGRLNSSDQWATFAVYCDASNIEVYAIGSDGKGQLAFTTTPDEVDALGVPETNTVIEDGHGIRIFRLSSGEFQVVGAADAEGKIYNVRFNGCPAAPGAADTFMTP
ncbi:MAG: hypothetical protein IT320_03145 [Anaerolineae bacterium]|nr:hypothetical protein [Anaerolineae bacterium]